MNSIVPADLQSHNSHSQVQTENQHLSLHDSEDLDDRGGGHPRVGHCYQQDSQKRKRNGSQFSRRCIRQRNPESHLHTVGEPSIPETGPTCIRNNGQPNTPQTVAHQLEDQRRDTYTNQRSRRSKRQRALMQNLECPSQNYANTVEEGSSFHTAQGATPTYDDLGDCSERCPYCGAAYWFGERLMSKNFQNGPPQYRLCCGGDLNGPELDPEIVQGLIHFLDTHNELVQLFRTARDKCAQHDVPEFKVRLYSGERPRGYELPASQTLGAIVFDSGPESESNYDVILEYRDGVVKRISKIHKSYMSLQFPLIFIYGQPGYHTKLMLRTADPNDEPKRLKRIPHNFDKHLGLLKRPVVVRIAG
ncbi:DNA helicase Pif1-like protein [Artemisia annua]|uniref:DNA helicase Pif1-like protein n=1 Tax=Artemisia annua TaxID=35608 RepID=A0A2U1MEA4_ARTAN|nr:DNA helicase Pif1-like protein [Artemisia annua]